MLKKLISLLVLTMYLHGLSGYAMSFHTCMITGFEKVYTGYGLNDPCNAEENDCRETSAHFEQADCCDVQQTIISIDDDGNISHFKMQLLIPALSSTHVQSFLISHTTTRYFYADPYTIRPPELCNLCIFRI
jgi:hypothetical protein